MDALIRVFAERGDLAHVALLLWVDDFVRELARFNARNHGE